MFIEKYRKVYYGDILMALYLEKSQNLADVANAAASLANIGGVTAAFVNAAVTALQATISVVGFSGVYNDLTGKPILATVATSGDYNDLINLPNLALLAPIANPTFTGTVTIQTSPIILIINAAGTFVTIDGTAGGNAGSFSVGLAANASNIDLGIHPMNVVGMHGSKVAQETVTGAKLPADVVLADLLTKLANKGIIVDGST